MNCLFCNICNGKIESSTIYEDDIVRVIMDINPTSNGHVLIIPKNHYDDFCTIDKVTIVHIHKIAKLIKKNIYDALNPDGLILTNNYGIAQVVKHYHLHLVPVYKDKQEILDINTVYNKIIKSII